MQVWNPQGTLSRWYLSASSLRMRGGFWRKDGRRMIVDGSDRLWLVEDKVPTPAPTKIHVARFSRYGHGSLDNDETYISFDGARLVP